MMITPKSTNASRWMRTALLAVLATTAASCNNEMPEAGINPEKPKEKMTLHVGTGQKAPETRVAYDDKKVDSGEGNTLTWQKDDRLTVALTYEGKYIFHKDDYEYKGEDGETYGTFEGTKIDITGTGVEWAVYYPNTVKINADGTATLPMTEQTQTANGDTKHLRDYMLMAATGLKGLADGFDLEMQSSIMKFDLSDIPAEVGKLKKLMWMVETDGETKRISLDFAPGAVNFGSGNSSNNTLTAFLSFMPQEMEVKDGGKFSVMLIGNKGYLAQTTVNGGKKYEAGKRYTAKMGSEGWHDTTMAMTVNVKEEDKDLGFFIPFDDGQAPANITVYWGDGSASTVASGTSFSGRDDFSHTYSVADTYTITIISDQTEAQKQIPKISFPYRGDIPSRANTPKLISVDTPLLNMGETDLSNCFEGCENLQSIPEGLFANNKEATDFSSCFSNCTNLQSIPEGLFAKNELATNFSFCFSNCTNLQSIPEGLFAKNELATNFTHCFNSCENLQSIPEGLFANNKEAMDFSGCFFYCTNLTLNEKIFSMDESPYDRFVGKQMNFTDCFFFVGRELEPTATGTAPDLWNYTGHETWLTDGCFTGANKKLSNWGEITKAWGGDQPDN